MVDLHYTRKILEKHLEEMNYEPFDVTIVSFEDDKGILKLTGKFQNGFLGDIYGFTAILDTNRWTLTQFKVVGKVG